MESNSTSFRSNSKNNSNKLIASVQVVRFFECKFNIKEENGNDYFNLQSFVIHFIYIKF